MAESIQITSFQLTQLPLLDHHAKTCLFWKSSESLLTSVDAAIDKDFIVDQEFEQEVFFSLLLLEWGTCGQVAFYKGSAAGAAFYAPPSFLPRAQVFPTSPPSPDAVLLMNIFVDKEGKDNNARKVVSKNINATEESWGIHTDLTRQVIRDLTRRGVRAIEAFGYQRPKEEQDKEQQCCPERCMIPADYLRSFGFHEIQPHPIFPRFRIELHRDHEWKEDVEAALIQRMAELFSTEVTLTTIST